MEWHWWLVSWLSCSIMLYPLVKDLIIRYETVVAGRKNYIWTVSDRYITMALCIPIPLTVFVVAVGAIVMFIEHPPKWPESFKNPSSW